MRRLAVFAIVLSLAGIAAGSGSFSAVFDVTALEAEFNLEQSITEVAGGTLYAGSGFAVSSDGVEKLQPYTMWCAGQDVVLAYGEVCAELRAPIVGPGSILRVFVTAVW